MRHPAEGSVAALIPDVSNPSADLKPFEIFGGHARSPGNFLSQGGDRSGESSIQAGFDMAKQRFC